MEKVATAATKVNSEGMRVPLREIRLPDNTNPRRAGSDVEGLAASIEQDGVLQGLVVTAADDGGGYLVIAGSRRLLALKLLEEKGSINSDYKVPVQVRMVAGEGRSEWQRLAMVENLQREDLHPLDQSAAWLDLLSNGMEVDDLAARTGLTLRTIRRRLALDNLCKEAREIFRGGGMNLSQAQALSLGTPDKQAEIIEHNSYRKERFGSAFAGIDADIIEDWITDEKVTVAQAIFPLEQYAGTYTTDLFQEEDQSYFDDPEQFVELQQAAIEAKIDEYRNMEAVEWVEVCNRHEGGYFHAWDYEKVRKNAKKYGVVIEISYNWSLTIHDRMKKRSVSENTRQSLNGAGDSGQPAKPPKPYYGPKLAMQVGRHKTLAVQRTLLETPRKAKEIAALRMLVGWSSPRSNHVGQIDYHGYLEKAVMNDEKAVMNDDGDTAPVEVATNYRLLDEAAASVVMALYPGDVVEAGLYALSKVADGNHGERWISSHEDLQLKDVYGRIKALTDDKLEEILFVLPILTFGEDTFEEIDRQASIFNTVAQDLDVDMKHHWRPDRAFLEMRTVPQLLKIAQDTAATGFFAKQTTKKKELVNELEKFFDAGGTEAARTWLPGAMLFPAVDETAGPVEPEIDPDDEHEDPNFNVGPGDDEE